MRGFKKSHVETEIYKFLDPRSFISQEKQIGEHGGTHFLLYGKDKSWMREIIFRENREANGGFNVCVECGHRVFETAEEGHQMRGEWHHIRSKPPERCDCSQNGAVICRDCHRDHHVRPQFGKRETVQV